MNVIKKVINRLLGCVGYKLRLTRRGKFEDQIQEDLHTIICSSKKLINKLSPDLKILNGPFEGMQYPSSEITELAFLPKISGVYEIQLQPLINEIIKTNYDNILDIGSAEGYYAVGLALRSPSSKVHCFDINEKDLQFCREMAKLNGAENLITHGFCSADTLINFNYQNRSLVFCDCEGYELELFQMEVIDALSQSDVLIEMHDIINPVISETILRRFAATHQVEIFDNSRNDYNRIDNLSHLTSKERYEAIFEHRGSPYQHRFMEWAYFTPRRC